MDTYQQHSSLGNSEHMYDDPLWTIELDFERSGAYHMERDESLARLHLENEGLPNILRLYSWQPPAVSIGFQQSMDSADLDACNLAGVDVVRRPTGGRAVLHANELTYAAVMRANPGEGIYAAHNRIIGALLSSLEGLGVE